MKKYIAIIITMLCLCLSACSMSSPDTTNKNGTTDAVDSVTPDHSTPPHDDGTTPLVYPLYYDAFSDFADSIKKENEESLYAELQEVIHGKISEEMLNKFNVFIDKMREKNVIVPCLNGKVIDLRNNEGFSNIALFASELYKLPWVFYYPTVSSDENFYIKMTFIPEHVLEKQKNPTASDVIKALSSSFPNINNLADHHKSIYNRELTLSDRKVTALVYEYKTDSRNSTMFVYDDWLVEVRSNPEVWSDEWFSTLSFVGFNK